MGDDPFPARWQCFIAVLCMIHALAHHVSDNFFPAYDVQGVPIGFTIGQEIPIHRGCVPISKRWPSTPDARPIHKLRLDRRIAVEGLEQKTAAKLVESSP